MMDGQDPILSTAREAARVGGEILLKDFGKLSPDQIDLKGKGDYVTDLDRRSEKAIIQKIKENFSDHLIHAEESGKEEKRSEYRWLLDPLDGTANYVHGIPLYGVSIAVLKGERIITGVVFDPSRDEMFWAREGKGAYLNGKAIHVSLKKKPGDAMLATGFPWRSKNNLDAYLDSFRKLFVEYSGIRRMGAASIDLAYTACGRIDGFWEMKLGPWDIAAGLLLIREAGGIATDFHGGDTCLTSGNVVAGNSDIHGNILKVTREFLGGIV